MGPHRSLLGALTASAVVLCASAACAQSSSLAQLVSDQGYLRRGDTGSGVGQLQSALTRVGQPLSVDGDFGPRTEEAVREFQRDQGLTVDGIVGPQTARRLDVLLGRGASSTRPSTPSRGGGSVGAAGRLAGLRGVDRPRTSDDPAKARRKALAWAQAAKAAGVRTLVVSYEGLWSFSSSYAKKVYDYQAALRRGERASAPTQGRMSFLAKKLIAPSLRRHHGRVELLLLPETSENRERSVARETAIAWNQVHGARLRLIVTGHSFGGYSALRLAKKLRRDGVAVDAMLTVDPRTTPGNYRHFVRPSNVGSHANFYQRSLGLPGYPIDGADNRKLTGTSHGRIPGHSAVKSRWDALMSQS